jgi:hypothetical protein
VTEAAPPLAERRARLIALAAAQRRRLAADVEPWRRPLAIADRGIAAARFIGHHPAWILGSAVAPVAMRATRLGAWFRRGLAAWQIVRGLRDRKL